MKTYLIFLAVFLSLYCKSQTQFCGSDEAKKQMQLLDPTQAIAEENQNAVLYNYLLSHGDNASRAILTIPIVFHILHTGGPENVSNATIMQSVNELNLRYQNSAPYYDVTGNPINIQFCLASVDPFGNPTNGITRDTSFRTVLPDYANPFLNGALKNVNRWCPSTYLNIWVVKNIVDVGGISVAGVGTFPAPGSDLFDGVLVEYPYLTNSYLLSHEIGHYLNLYHTFNNGCRNFNCMVDGDKVCDTPPDNSTNTCNGNSCSTDLDDTTGLSPFTVDMNELPNYMDYSTCASLSFTQGQAARMQAALTLLRSSLLSSNGCGSHPGGAVPVASFIIDSSFCTGRLGFTSTSTNGLYTSWDFQGDGRVDTVGTTVFHKYTSPGYYHIKMMVSGYGGSDTLTKIIYVRVGPNQTYPILNTYTGIVMDPFLHTLHTCPGRVITFTGAPGMAHYQWSTGDTTQSITYTADSSFTISLVTTDQNGNPWISCYPVHSVVDAPQLHVVSNLGRDTARCGQYVLLSLSPMPYYNVPNNTWYYNGSVQVHNQLVDALGAWNVGTNSYWVTNTDINGCVSQTDTLTYYVVDQVPTISQHGNVLTLSHHCLNTNWYKVGATIAFTNDSSLVISSPGCYYAYCNNCVNGYTDTLCVTLLGLEGISETENNVIISPNPFSSETTLTFSREQKQTIIKIIDVIGREIKTISFTGKQLVLEKGEMNAGVYFIQIEDENKNILNKKIVVN